MTSSTGYITCAVVNKACSVTEQIVSVAEVDRRVQLKAVTGMDIDGILTVLRVTDARAENHSRNDVLVSALSCLELGN